MLPTLLLAALLLVATGSSSTSTPATCVRYCDHRPCLQAGTPPPAPLGSRFSATGHASVPITHLPSSLCPPTAARCLRGPHTVTVHLPPAHTLLFRGPLLRALQRCMCQQLRVVITLQQV
jgi:hypothetical protein